MTFATATIQGYVTYLKGDTTKNTKRAVVNMLIAVPNKRENMTTSDTYKVSVWDNQALAALEYIKSERKQIITVSGILRLDEYSVAQGKPIMRLDFASILDYGKTNEAVTKDSSDKQKFVNMIDSIEDAKLKAIKVKEKTVSI